MPDLPLAEIKGNSRHAPAGRRHPADRVIAQTDPRGNPLYWIGPPGEKLDGGTETDFAAVDEGYLSVTALNVDLTAHNAQAVPSAPGWPTLEVHWEHGRSAY
ncbi:hypothetical protein WDV93_16205 [Pantoea ananatis]